MDLEAEVGWTLPEALQELAICGDREIVVELLSLFQTDSGARLQLLRSAVERGDWRRARAEAHSIRGSAVQVGANALAEACHEMELTAETHSNPGLLLHEIEARFAAASKAISLEYGAAQ